jgi:Ca-activated chloride channel family protein
LTMLLACCHTVVQAQQPKKIVREGNKLYEAKKYKEAAATYQKAVQKDPKYTPGLFNLGNSLYKQKEYENARKVMAATGKTITDKQGKSATAYNIGNTYMEERKWQEAVDAYKQALRNNPGDADAKYNLSYALAMMKKNNGGGGGKNDKQDKNNDKKDDKKDQQQDQQGKDKQDQNKDQQQDQQDKQDEQDKQDKRPQPQPSKLSEQQAEQLLNALQQEEKKLQDKMQKAKGVPVKIEKDW